MCKEFYFGVFKELRFWSQFLDCVMQNGKKGMDGSLQRWVEREVDSERCSLLPMRGTI